MFVILAEKATLSKANPELSEKEITDETTVQLLARLQQHQTAENNALYALMTEHVCIASLPHTSLH